MKMFNAVLVLLTTLLISACSSDPETPKEQFIADGETFNLKDAKLYLVDQADFLNGNGNFVYRDYFITDGTYVSGNGWALEDYTDATYYFAFEVIVPEANGFVAGSYSSLHNFSSLGATENGLYFYGENEVETMYYKSTAGASTGNFTISGGMNDGETMTVKFNGGLSHWVYDVNWVETEFTGKISVKAQVEDVRAEVK